MSLAVTGIGMVTSLGLDAVTSCAAARAGVNRAGEVDDVFTYDADADAEVPVIGHPVKKLSSGLFGTSRLLQLALGAIDDLKRTLQPLSAYPVGLVLLLPSGAHQAHWYAHLQAHPDDDPRTDPVEGARELATFRERLTFSLPKDIVTRSELPVRPQAQSTLLADQSGFVRALSQARTWLQQGIIETCLIGAVDSYLDPDTIAALAGLGLLRTPTHPVGFMPGEGACFLAVEDAQSARARGKKALLRVGPFNATEGAAGRLEDRPVEPQPLFQALATLGTPEAGVLVVNLNGDDARAVEWGNVVSRNPPGLLRHAQVLVPPLFFGELGNVTGPVSIALLAQSWARSWAASNDAVIALMEDGATRCAISATRAE